MGIISGGRIIEGSGLGTPLQNAGAPVAGTNEVQTVTLGGTGGTSTFKLVLDGIRTAAIAWSATNGTLLSNVNTALDATFGTSMIVATDSTLSSGLGNFFLTFSGTEYAKRVVNTMTGEIVTGALTIAIVETTPGVNATGRGAAVGAQLIDVTNALAYINTGTTSAPTWTKVGTQT